MNFLFRLLVAIYAFLLLVVSFVFLAIGIQPAVLKNIYEFFYPGIEQGRIIIIVISAGFLIMSILFLVSGIISEGEKKSIKRTTDVGDIWISLGTIESIAINTTRKIQGIKDSKVYVKKINDSVSLILKLVIFSDINVPTLTEEVQLKVKNSIEEMTEIKVNEVGVFVDNIYSGYKTRVE